MSANNTRVMREAVLSTSPHNPKILCFFLRSLRVSGFLVLTLVLLLFLPARYYQVSMSAPFRDSSSRVLEFDQFRDLLAAYISSSLGKVRVSKLAPTTDRDWIIRQQQLAEEARQFYAAGGRFEFSGLFDAHSLLAKSRIAGAVLELDELRDLVLMADKAS